MSRDFPDQERMREVLEEIGVRLGVRDAVAERQGYQDDGTLPVDYDNLERILNRVRSIASIPLPQEVPMTSLRPSEDDVQPETTPEPEFTDAGRDEQPKRYVVKATLSIGSEDTGYDDDFASMSTQWDGLPMAGVLAIELQFHAAFLTPLLALGAAVELQRETDPSRRAALQGIVAGLPEPEVLRLMGREKPGGTREGTT